MAFSPKTGCPMCGIVATALNTPSSSPRSPTFQSDSTQPEILWRDDNFTAYREKVNPVSSKGHIIVAFNLHVPSIYTLSSSDLPLLVNIRNLAKRLLYGLPSPSPLSPSATSTTSATPTTSTTSATSILNNSSAFAPLHLEDDSRFRIGFITPPFKDNKIPVTDHLHAHAFIEPADLMGWWRGIAYGPLAWYAIDDLVAEIRESVSNNRVKSGYENRRGAPIDMVPHAGARAGTANGLELTEPGLANPDLEEGSPDLMPRTPTLQSGSYPTSSIPHLRV